MGSFYFTKNSEEHGGSSPRGERGVEHIHDHLGQSFVNRKRFPLQVIPPGVGPGGLAALLLPDESRLRGMKMSLLIA